MALDSSLVYAGLNSYTNRNPSATFIYDNSVSGWRAAMSSDFGGFAAQDSTITSSSTGFEKGRSFKSTSGNLINLFGYSDKTSAQFISIFSNSGVPANGSVPTATFLVPSSGSFSFDSKSPLKLQSGIYVGNSTSGAVFNPGNNDLFLTAIFV